MKAEKIKVKRVTPFIIFWILYLSYTSTYILRLNLSVAKPALEQLGKLDTAQLAFLGSIFSLVYALGKLLNGAIGDRLKPWIMVTIGLFFAGLSNILVGFLPPYGAMAFGWGLNAFGQSMLWGCILRIVSVIYDEQTAQKKATVMGTSIAVGNVLGILVASYLVNEFGPAYAFIIPGAAAVILGVAVILSARGVECGDGKRVQPLKMLLRKDIQVMILPAMIQGLMKDNVSLFMVDYFVKQFEVDPTRNSLYVLFIPLSGLAGRTLYPMLYKRTGYNENKAAVWGFVFCALFALPLSIQVGGATVATLCLCGIYAFVSIVNASFLSVFPIRYAKSGNVSTVCGIMDFVIYLGHAISTAVYGIMIVKFGYSSMYVTWVIFSIIAAVILLKIKDVRPDSE